MRRAVGIIWPEPRAIGEASRERSVSLNRVLRIATVSGKYFNPRKLVASNMIGRIQPTFFT